MKGVPGTDPWLRSFLFLELSRAQFQQGRLLPAADSALEGEFWGKEARTAFGEFFAALHLGTLNLHRGHLRAGAREIPPHRTNHQENG